MSHDDTAGHWELVEGLEKPLDITTQLRKAVRRVERLTGQPYIGPDDGFEFLNYLIHDEDDPDHQHTLLTRDKLPLPPPLLDASMHEHKETLVASSSLPSSSASHALPGHAAYHLTNNVVFTPSGQILTPPLPQPVIAPISAIVQEREREGADQSRATLAASLARIQQIAAETKNPSEEPSDTSLSSPLLLYRRSASNVLLPNTNRKQSRGHTAVVWPPVT